MGKTIRGVCKLCRQSALLRKSHIMPKWCFRRLSGALGCGHPVLVTPDGIVQTSKQITDHLLCNKCEGRICAWEDYLSRITTQEDGSFPALSGLVPLPATVAGVVDSRRGGQRAGEGTSPHQSGEGGPLSSAQSPCTDMAVFVAGGEAADRTVDVRSAAHLRTSEIALFAASVFWRASVSTKYPDCQLGAQEPAIRAYLLGKIPFPSELRLKVDFVMYNRRFAYGMEYNVLDVHRHMIADGYDVYNFMLFGIRFYLVAGPRVPAMACFTENGYICVSEADDIARRTTAVIAKREYKGGVGEALARMRAKLW